MQIHDHPGVRLIIDNRTTWFYYLWSDWKCDYKFQRSTLFI